jgi:hypothetical protein
MPAADRHRLLFGPYRTPVFKYGDVVICDVRGTRRPRWREPCSLARADCTVLASPSFRTVR